MVILTGENNDHRGAFPKGLTCFLLDFTQDVEEGRFHSVAVQCMFPEKRSIHSNKWQQSQNTHAVGTQGVWKTHSCKEN